MVVEEIIIMITTSITIVGVPKSSHGDIAFVFINKKARDGMKHGYKLAFSCQ